MTEGRTPKAWLPAVKFIDVFALKYEAILKDINEVGQDYKIRCWERRDNKYRLALTARVYPSSSKADQAVIEIAISKSHQSSMDVKALSDGNFKRPVETALVWVRTMAGRPSAFALANHTLAGIDFALGLKPDMGFEFQAITSESQNTLDGILKSRSDWKKNGTTEIHFLAN
jgi:hypothetical protein